MDPYSSHLPVLKAIGKLLKPSRIIEFGSGFYSTGCFLDKSIFPDLQKLTSYESNLDWYHKMNGVYGSDPRLSFIQTSEPESIQNISETFDLAFVDGQMATMRVPTAKVAKAIAPVVVLHDAEQEYSAAALLLFKHVYLFKDLSPWTAVLSDSVDFSLLT